MAATKRDTHPIDTMLAISDVLTHPRLAQLYTRVRERDTATVDELATGLDSSSTTIYEDVNRLTDMGLLERVTETQPHRYRAPHLSITVAADEGSYEITPTLIAALARSTDNQNLELYRDRHGTAGLAIATEYARAYVKGKMTSRIMARELDLSVLEAETILQELREIIVDVEPDAQDDLDLDAIDAEVNLDDEDLPEHPE